MNEQKAYEESLKKWNRIKMFYQNGDIIESANWLLDECGYCEEYGICEKCPVQESCSRIASIVDELNSHSDNMDYYLLKVRINMALNIAFATLERRKSIIENQK